MKSIIFASVVVLVLAFSFSTSDAWLIYHKTAFRGRIIDAETKAPIRGAVVVVVYYEHDIVGGPGGGDSSVIKAKETLTDIKGEFYFPAYTTLTGPNSRESDALFIIFKPGYMSSDGPLENINTEKFFSADVVGKVGEIRRNYGEPEVWKGPLGVVELKRGERDPSTPTDYRSKELPLLFKALNEDRRNRGYKGELK